MRSPREATARWVMVALGALALFVLGFGLLRPKDLAIAAGLLLPILIWSSFSLLGRLLRRLPAVDSALRQSVAGRVVWPDIAIDLAFGAAAIALSLARGLPWWARLLALLIGCLIAAEVGSWCVKVWRARSRGRMA